MQAMTITKTIYETDFVTAAVYCLPRPRKREFCNFQNQFFLAGLAGVQNGRKRRFACLNMLERLRNRFRVIVTSTKT